MFCQWPAELLPLFTAREIEEVISGHSDVDIDLLKRCTEYDDIDPNGETATNFWKVVEGFSNEEIATHQLLDQRAEQRKVRCLDDF